MLVLENQQHSLDDERRCRLSSRHSKSHLPSREDDLLRLQLESDFIPGVTSRRLRLIELLGSSRSNPSDRGVDGVS